jgi:hypothetical protein
MPVPAKLDHSRKIQPAPSEISSMEKAKASNNQKMVLIERISSFIPDLPAVLGHVGTATLRRR